MPSKRRPSLPKNLDFNIRYNSAFKCCVCRNSPVEQIHHIDEDSSNNTYDNLIGLCNTCHSEAHTKHKLSRNLTPEILINAKKRWEKEVLKNNASSMIATWGGTSSAMWTFFNFEKIPYLLDELKISFNTRIYNSLKSKKAINDNAIPIVKNFKKCRMIYDTFDYDTSHDLFNLYNEATNKLLQKIDPIEFCITRKKTELKSIIHVGKFIYFNRGVTFKKANTDRTREAFFSYNKIRVEFILDERFIWANSCYVNSFVGTNIIFGVLFVKSITNSDGTLIFSCSPIALGYGFNSNRESSPFYPKLSEVNKSSVYSYARYDDSELEKFLENYEHDPNEPIF